MIKLKNLCFLYFDTENSSMTTSLALIYKKVPELTAKKNPSIKLLVPANIIQSIIPIGVIEAKSKMNFTVSYSN